MPKKVTNSHSSAIEEARGLVRAADRIPEPMLKRIALCTILPQSKSKFPKLILKRENGGCLYAKVVSQRGTQVIRFYGDATRLETEISHIWERLHPKKNGK